jgi:cysteine desulfurase/selenocysteine lyase
MTINDILNNEALRRKEFPIAKHKIYLAHAAVSPLPARVTRAINDYIKRASTRGQFEYLHNKIEEETRDLAARLLEARPDEIAFVPSTSAGLSLIANGLDWKRGDNVIIADGDFPANIYPWLNLQRRGVEVRFIPRKSSGVVSVSDVKSQIDERTRLVSLSSVHFVTGAPIDMNGIGRLLRKNGVLFCVDGIQSLGAMPCSVRYVDFLVADAHKWLLGPQGFGLLFVRRQCWNQLHPPLVGWKSVRTPKEFLNIKLEFPDSAKRYEPGSLNIVGLIGLHAALSLILEIEVSVIAKQIKILRTGLTDGLMRKGYNVLGVSSPAQATGIASFKRDDKETVALYQKLDKSGIIVSLRDDLMGGKCIRVSPHFYNTEKEIHKFLSNI